MGADRGGEGGRPLIRALAIGPAARRWLRGSAVAWPVETLHVREDGWLLAGGDGRVLHLATRGATAAPFAVRLDVAALAGKPGGAVAVADGVLACGDLRVALAGVPDWRCRPPWRELRVAGRDVGLDIGGAALPAAAADVAAPLDRLLAALAAGAAGVALATVKELAGRGPGLTPAGDDALLGVVHALWATSAEAADLAAQLAATALPRTTRLSGAWLCAASRGEAGAPWLAFLRALAAGDGAAVVPAKAGVEAWGATSGRVALAAFTAAVAARSPVAAAAPL